MTKRVALVCLLMLAVMTLASPAWAAPAPKQTTPAIGQKAGNISALLPTAHIVRGLGKAATSTDAKKGDEIVWNDLIKTEKGGRARITLTDQSILSLGSQAELRILKHDAKSQQTALQLGYGRIRAEVATVTRDGGKFELRTPTAVAGVIGTDFGTDSSIPGTTTFVCISGLVQVGSSDPAIPGTVPCAGGQTTTVSTGTPPTPPKPATPQQIQQLIQDTEPAVISGLVPGASLPGATLAAVANGTHMGGISGVNVSGAGVTVSLAAGATDASVPVSITVAAGAAPGPRTITFTKPNGTSSAAVFSVLTPPGGAGALDAAALKKAYTDIIEAERQSAIAGINAVGVGVQQSADQGGQQVSQANSSLNPPINLDPMATELKGDVSPLLDAMVTAGTAVNKAASDSSGKFDSDADALIASLEGQGKSADDVRAGVKSLFDAENKDLLTAFGAAQSPLGGSAKDANAKIVTTVQNWLAQVNTALAQNGPVPKTNKDDVTIDVGNIAEFDAASSLGTGGGTISGFSWVLCDATYHPDKIGVVLPANAPGCTALPGFSSAVSDFKVNTCSLNPASYIARVTVTDSNQQSRSMDVRVRVQAPSYDDPAARLNGLAQAYMALKPDMFTQFFDSSFAGLTTLQENIRKTFASLNSMSINLKVSQATVDCNSATVRADWDQNYTFLADATCAGQGASCQRVVFHQSEQLTTRMVRVPGKGWFMTEFSGDNGTVQGTPPGPIQTDVALPDMQISNLGVGAAASAVRVLGPSAGVAPGNNTLQAVVVNTGNASLNAVTTVRFSVRDANNNEISFTQVNVPLPLNAGASTTVTGVVVVPNLPPGTPGKITATVNPGCLVPEKNCDGADSISLDIVIGNADLGLSNLTTGGSLIGTQPGSVSVTITNTGSGASLASSQNLVATMGGAVIGKADIPAIPAGGTTTVSIPVVFPNLAGAQPVTVAITPAAVGDNNGANDSIAGSITLVQAVVDLKPTLTLTTAQPWTAGQTVAASVAVNNSGNVPSNAADTLACTFGGVSVHNAALGAVTAGGSVSTPLSFAIPANKAPSAALSCTASTDALETAAAAANNTVSSTITVSPNIDLQITAVGGNTGQLQMGSAFGITATVKNAGLDDAPAGWSAILSINGSQVVNIASNPALPAGANTGVTFSGTVPNTQAAPADVSVPSSIQINVNNAVTETNTANDTNNFNLNLVDFTLNAVSPTISVVQSIAVNTPAVTVLPATYALPITVSYAGLPTGVAGGGTGNLSIVGTPTVAGAFPVTVTGTSSGVSHTASFNVNVGAAFVDLKMDPPTFPQAAPWISGLVLDGFCVLHNNGNVASAPTTITGSFNGVAPFSGSVASIPAGGSLNIRMSTAVPINLAPSTNFVCSVPKDPQEAATNVADNTASTPNTPVDYNVDLQMINLPSGVPTPTFQAGEAAAVPAFDVKNFGPDTAPAGWNVILNINGTQVASVTGGSLAGGAQQNISTLSFTAPSVSPAPSDTTVPAFLKVNANNAVQETNTGNDTFNAPSGFRIEDFTATLTQTSVKMVEGRPVNWTIATILPATFDIPLVTIPGGFPTGVSAGTGLVVSGTPTVGSAGSYNPTPQIDANGVTKSLPALPITVVQEIHFTETVLPNLLAGGSSQPLTISFTGGVYPLTVAVTLPAGITAPEALTQTLAAPGSLTWNVKSDFTAATGALLANVHVTDGGVPAVNVPAGSVSGTVDIDNGTQANYVLQSATLTNHPTPPTGTNAFQVGESVDFNVNVQNTGNGSPAGTITVQITCAPACGTFTNTVPAPTAGSTTGIGIVMPVSAAPGSYVGTIAITSAPAQSTTADDSLTGFNFDVADFNLSLPGSFTPHNVLVGDSGDVDLNLSEPGGNPATFTMPITASAGAAGVTVSAVSPQAANSTQTTHVNVPNTVASNTNDLISYSSIRFGVFKQVQAGLHYCTMSLVNQTSGGIGESSADPVIIGIGSGGYPLQIKMQTDCDLSIGPSTLGFGALTGFSVTYDLNTVVNGDIVTATLMVSAGITPNVVTPVTLTATVPGTLPARTISHTIFILAKQTAELSIDPPSPVVARNFTTAPLLSGEGIDLNLTIHNNGAGPSTAGINAMAYIGSASATVPLPSIPSGGSTTVTVHLVAPVFSGIAITGGNIADDVDVDVAAAEQNGADNANFLPISYSDWGVAVSGPGTSASPLVIGIVSGTGSTTIALQLPAGATTVSAMKLVQGATTTTISPVGLPMSYSAGTLSNTLFVSGTGPNGEYAAQVIMQIIDPSTGQPSGISRQATVHIKWNTGVPVATVTLASDRNNVGSVGCSSGCPTPVQINGLLVESVNLTPSRSPAGTGTVDLWFSDQGAILSNTDTSANQGPANVTATYGSPQLVNFAAEEINGLLTAGPANVVVSAAAVTGVRINPSPDPTGSQQSQLFFNIGDLAIQPPGAQCDFIPPTQTKALTFNLLPLGGFNAGTLTYVWQTLPSGVSVDVPSGSVGISGSTYPDLVFNFTNSNTGDTGVQSGILSLTISNGNGAATAFYVIDLELDSTGLSLCGGAGGAGRVIRASWRHPGVSSAAVRLSKAKVTAGAPDLQVRGTDVTFTPSIPKAGDSINVRFRITNAGDADATHVPIALQVRGITVAQDTFDVPAGKSTLAAIEWNNAQAPVGAATRVMAVTRASRGQFVQGEMMGGGLADNSATALNAVLVIDPNHTVNQKTTNLKQVSLTQLALRNGDGTTVGSVGTGGMGAGLSRARIEIGDACVGFRFSSGAQGACESGDIEITVIDFTAGRFEISSGYGIADLGAVSADAAVMAPAAFASRAVGLAGHTYAVQLPGGKVGVFTINSISNPRKLQAAADKRFNAAANRVARRVAGNTQAVEAGDVSGHDVSSQSVMFDVLYRLR